MTYKLFYAERSAAMGTRVVLEEIGADYELLPASISKDEPRSKEHLALNPNGWVPVLIWPEGAMYECAAINIFLCDLHPEAGLCPLPNDDLRGRYLQWLVFFTSSVQNAYQMTYYPFRFCATKDDEPAVQARATSRLREVWQVVDDGIGDGDWVLGNQFSSVDIYLYMLITWLSEDKGHPLVSEFANVHRVFNKVALRPSIQKVYC
ncbi:MAG: glutathione S-transferase [Parasphingorhabdus sp.]|jgi:glutathione S-transferase